MKRRKAFWTAIIIAAIFGVLVFYYNSSLKSVPEPSAQKSRGQTEIAKIKRYYVLVSTLDSEKDNAKKAELVELVQKGSVKIQTKDINEISEFLGAKIESPTETLELKEKEIGILKFDDLSPKYKVLDFEGKSIWEDGDYSFFVNTKKSDKEEGFDQKNVIKMTSVGDIILSRTVYVKMRQNGYASPFKNVAERLKGADLTFGNLEVALSDLVTPPTAGMSFVAPKAAIEGIVLSGIDILGLANNHSTNFGTKVFADSINLLKEKGIEFVGGGINSSEAKKFKIVNVKEKKFAFLAANSIVGDIPAGQNSPGTWHFDLPPWGTRNETEVQEILENIKAAKKESDFTIIMVHWGTEYTADPSPEMKTLGREFIDAGADLVVGTHPHWVQGVEAYKNGFISYSLGNFVFDQEWSLETKQGLIMDTIFYKDKLVNVSITPVLIEDFNRPRILGKEEGKKIMDEVWASSRKIGD